jgi:hypothetical protein
MSATTVLPLAGKSALVGAEIALTQVPASAAGT